MSIGHKANYIDLEPIRTKDPSIIMAENSKKKQALAKRMFASISQKQTNETMSLLDKVLRNAHEDLDGQDAFRRKDGRETILKLFAHLMPKETAPLVQINNNKQITNINGGVEMLSSLKEFMSIRTDKIKALENRTIKKKLSLNKEVKPKMPANLPINQGNQ